LKRGWVEGERKGFPDHNFLAAGRRHRRRGLNSGDGQGVAFRRTGAPRAAMSCCTSTAAANLSGSRQRDRCICRSGSPPRRGHLLHRPNISLAPEHPYPSAAATTRSLLSRAVVARHSGAVRSCCRRVGPAAVLALALALALRNAPRVSLPAGIPRGGAVHTT